MTTIFGVRFQSEVNYGVRFDITSTVCFPAINDVEFHCVIQNVNRLYLKVCVLLLQSLLDKLVSDREFGDLYLVL